jgi:tetratricopeptide (TPR) repeat protein
MQDNISRSILDTLRVQLTPASLRVLQQATGTRNEAAYDDYMLGNAWYQKADPASVRKAVAYFTSAARRDTAFAAPLLGLLRGYDLLANVEPNVTNIAAVARDSLLRRARALDPSSGEVRAFAAWNYARKCDTTAADREWQEAVRLTPGSAELRRDYAVFLSSRGRYTEALKTAREAAMLDRTSPWVQSVLAQTYIIAGAHEPDSIRRAGLFASALDVSERFLALDTMQWVSNAVRGAAEMHTGSLLGGITHLKIARRLGGDMHALTTGYLGWAHGMVKQRKEALEIAKILE